MSVKSGSAPSKSGPIEPALGMSSSVAKALSALVDRITTPRHFDQDALIGVDLGTAHIAIVAVDEFGYPLAGATQAADVVRDGLVMDYVGAVRIVSDLLSRVRSCIGGKLIGAMAAFPPQTHHKDAAYVGHVVEAAELNLLGMVEEPVAANALLKMANGALVDVGGGTTGIAVFSGGRLVCSVDQPTGGIHLSLTLAGSFGVSLREAEAIKCDGGMSEEVLSVVRPVIEKIASIILQGIAGHDVQHLVLVGGTAALPGLREIIERETGIPTITPTSAALVTPLGIALTSLGGDTDGGEKK